MGKSEMTEKNVQASVDDWIKRLQKLYSQIKEWVMPIEGIRVVENQNAVMYEELMQKFSISPKPIPTLDIYDGDDLIARLKPIGLWVIGARGRVDLMLRDGAVILVDESQESDPSRWVAHDKLNFRKGQDLSSEYLLNMLGLAKHECV